MSRPDSSNIPPVIEMQNVGIRYGQGPEILSDVKLSLKKGSFHFLTGKSGAGKTSLLSMMYLAQKPSRGIVNVFGKNVNFTNRDSLSMLRRKIGVVFQDFRLLDHLSAFDNVALPLFVELNKLGTTVVIATHSEKLINDFSYPRLHLQNHGLHILYPGNSRFGGQI